MAPEVLTGEPYDQRADVYGAGALLWEALSGKPLLTETDPAAVAARVRAGELPKATIPAGAPWAKDLVGVAAKALSPSPDDRWPNASLMAGELRKAAGLKLAPVSTTAAFAKSAIAERSKARRQGLETQAPMQPAPAPAQAVALAPAPATPPPSTRPAAPAVAPPRPETTAASPRPPLAVPRIAAPSPSPPPAVPIAPPVAVETASAPQPEPEALLDSDVLVAPGLRAPVADVVELGSEALLEASDSIPPPPAASGPVMLNPFALTAGPPHPPPHAPPPPPPPPPPILEAVVAQPPPAPPAAPPVAEEPALPPRAMLLTEPSLTRLSERDAATRRRKVLVLGGVAGLGALILVLAVVRWATRDPSTHESPKPPVVAQVAPVAPPPASAPVAATPSATIPSARPSSAAVPPPSAASTAAPVVAPARPPPAAKPPAPPPVAAAARPRPAAPARPAPAAPPRPKKTKPAFDPNTL